MAFLRISLCVALLAMIAACGNKIGDSCAVNTDCSAEGGRVCDANPQSPGGYCTIPGCDLNTCPSESECVQFYSVINLDKRCTRPEDCTLDQICTVGGFCAARDSELRFCMLSCSSHGDCRDGYECRDLSRMGMHGGQPVRAQGQPDEELKPFCAAALPCAKDADCDLGDHCDLGQQRCTR